MQKPCVICGTPFEAKRDRAKYCGAACRQRSYRGASPIPQPAVEIRQEQVGGETPGPLYASTLEELTAVGRHETSRGIVALTLAKRIDLGIDAGSGMASLAKQFSAAMAEATEGTVTEASAAEKRRDELAARRAVRSA